jgi:glycosyltransferase involved in cell wall biosynthesis
MIARRLSRLLVPLPSTRLGGTERHTADLCTRIVARTAMEIHLAAEPALHEGLRRWLGPGVALHAASLGTPASQPAEARRLRDALRPDAAFVPLPWPDAGDGLLPELDGLPRLVLLHLAPEAPAPVVAPALALESAVCAAVSAPVARRAALAWGIPRVAVLPNPAPSPAGYDRAVARAAVRSGLGLHAEAPLLLFVGRLEEAKGAELLPDISDRLPVPLAVAGDGPLRGLLDTRAATDPRGLFRMLGPLADPAPWFLAADALLMPSRLEGAPLVFLEAAAHRCPVVATAAALEALGEDAPRLAWIAATPDAPGMAQAAEAALDDAEATAHRVALAAAHATRHGWDATVDQALGLLRAAALRGDRIAA